jgi:hypothetical protein
MATSHRPQGRERGEVRDHVLQDPVKPGHRQEAHGQNQLPRAGVLCLDPSGGGEAREQDHETGHDGEQRRRMGQRVAGGLDDVQGALDGGFLGFTHGTHERGNVSEAFRTLRFRPHHSPSSTELPGSSFT